MLHPNPIGLKSCYIGNDHQIYYLSLRHTLKQQRLKRKSVIDDRLWFGQKGDI